MELDLGEVIDAMPVGVWVCDATGNLVVVNRTALEVMGASSLEEARATAHPFHLLTARTEDGKPIPHDKTPLLRALAGERVVHEMEVIDHRTRGTIVLRTRSRPIRNPDGKIIGAVKVANDVTKEHELANVRDEFIRQAAHELKTPIAVIRATAETLGADPQSAASQLGALVRGVERMDGLINSLLDLADLQGGIFSFSRFPVPLEHVITGALARLPSTSSRRVHVSYTSVIVRCDEARMRRAVYALVDNALKYSPTDTVIEVSLTREDDTARIAIRDHGFGIPEDKQPYVFQKYFRAHIGTNRDAGGIGVGLYVAREIVHQHGGQIWFESAENRGSVFYIEMPIEAEAT